MFLKWRRKRETRRIQDSCPHEWHIVSEYRAYNYDYDMFESVCDLYCSVCDKEDNKAEEREAEKIIRKQEIKNMKGECS